MAYVVSRVCQLPLQLVQASIPPESVGLRKPPKNRVPTVSSPTDVTRNFINDLHDYILDERQYVVNGRCVFCTFPSSTTSVIVYCVCMSGQS